LTWRLPDDAALTVGTQLAPDGGRLIEADVEWRRPKTDGCSQSIRYELMKPTPAIASSSPVFRRIIRHLILQIVQIHLAKYYFR
jgi:hypothetical protein